MTKTYQRGGEKIEVLHGIDLDIAARRLRGAHGPVRLGQDHPAQPHRRARHADRRQHRGGWRAHRPARERRAVALAGRPRRLRVPVLQPAAGAVGPAERRAAAAADQPVGRPAPPPRGDRARPGGARGSRPAQAARAVGRPGTTGGHRAGHRLRSHPPRVRRAHRRSRPGHRRRDPDPAADAQPRARQDHRDGHPRPQGRRVRAPSAPSGQGHPGRPPERAA